MPTALQRKWHFLPTGRPGERFRKRYHQHHQSGKKGFVGMIVRFLLAAACAIIGFVLVFIPGPAVLFFLLAGALLATDWLPVARLLDWGEVHVRRLAGRVKEAWDRLGWAARVALVAAAALLAAAAAWALYQVLR